MTIDATMETAGLGRRAGPGAAVIFFAFLALYLLGNGSHQLWDRDEPRYATATAEMIRSGNYIIPTFNGETRYEKPVLIYWLMSVPMRLFGPTDFAARFAQGVCGALAMAFIWLTALRLGATAAGALVAAVAVGLSPLVLVVSKSSTIDAALLLAIVIAIHAHAGNLMTGFAWRRHIVFWVAVGATILLKGPPGPVFLAAAVLGERAWTALGRRRGWGCDAPEATSWGRVFIRSCGGVLVACLVVAYWVIAAWMRTDGDFFLVQFREHALGHAVGGKEGHTGPPYYYLPVLLVAAAIALPALVATIPWSARATRRREVRMLMSWAVIGLVVFSFAGTKLPHYMVPVMAAWGLMAGLAWPGLSPPAGPGGPLPYRRWMRTGAVLLGLFAVVAGAGLIGLSYVGPFPGLRVPGIVAAVVLAAGLLPSAVLWWRGRPSPGLMVGVAAWVAAWVVILLWFLPALEPVRPSRNLANWLRANAPPDTEVLAVGFQEPSLVFYWGRPVTMMGKGEGREVMSRLQETTRPAALVIPKERLDRWLSYRGDGQLPAALEVKHEGRYYDFQSGDGWMTLQIVGNWGRAAAAP